MLCSIKVKTDKTQERELFAFLAAMTLMLALCETVLPRPMPFFRLGLANLPILIALNRLSIPYLSYLTIFKVFGCAILNGTLFSPLFLFGLGGTSSSVVTMLCLSRFSNFILIKKGFSLFSMPAISCLGAFAHSLIQIYLADLLLFGSTAWVMFPLLLVTGEISAWLLGAMASSIRINNAFLQQPLECDEGQSFIFASSQKWVWVRYLVAITIIICFLINDSLIGQGIVLFTIWLFVFIMTRKWLSFFMPIISFGVILIFNQFFAYGELLFAFCGMRVYEGSFKLGLRRALFFIGLVEISRMFFVSSFLRFRGDFFLGEVFKWYRYLLKDSRVVLILLYGEDRLDRGLLGKIEQKLKKYQIGRLYKGRDLSQFYFYGIFFVAFLSITLLVLRFLFKARR